MKKGFASIIIIAAGAIILGSTVFGMIKYGDKLMASISHIFKSENQSSENGDDGLRQELEKLKKEIESLQNDKVLEKQTQNVVKMNNNSSSINISPADNVNEIKKENNFVLELNASRYSLPADGEAVSFLTIIIKDKNGQILENFDEPIEFVTTSGILSPSVIAPKNGMASTQLISSTVPTNLNVVAKCGEVNSNNINLSFAAVESSQQHVSINNNISIDSGDVQGIVGLYCDEGWGSGVIISLNGYILTNHHVVENSKFCKVYVSYREEMLPLHKYNAVALDYYNEDLDVAMLRINQNANSENIIGTGESFSYFLPTENEIKIGNDVWLLGYPIYGSKFSPIIMTKGIISGLDGDFVNTDIKMSGGNSGGPIFDSDKKIVGIAKHVQIGSADVLGGFVNIFKIKDWYNSLGRSWPQ